MNVQHHLVGISAVNKALSENSKTRWIANVKALREVASYWNNPITFCSNIHIGGLNSCFAQLSGSVKKATSLSCWHTNKIKPSAVYLSSDTVFCMKSDLFKLFLML